MRHMPRLLPTLSLLLAPGLLAPASATSLRLYPTFAEVRREVNPARPLTFTAGAWSLLQPGSLGLSGVPLAQIRVRPTDLDWLTTQEGQPVQVMRAGGPALEGTLVRAADLLVRLSSGESLNVRPEELAFASEPPAGWLQGGVEVRFEGAGVNEGRGVVQYRTQALSWSPRYELGASGSTARLSALADLRNISAEAFDAGMVELFAGEVRNALPYGQISELQSGGVMSTSALPVPVTPGIAGRTGAGSASVSSLGEVRGLQRYALPGGLRLGRGERLTVPFVQPKITEFTRYASVSTYFSPQSGSGRTSRHYRFVPGAALPSGPLTVREDGLLIGTVTLPAAQAGRGVDLDLGADHDLRFTRTVKTLGQEKNPAGKVVATTYEVTYTLISTKARSTRVQLREQVYGRGLAVDGKAVTGQQANIARRVEVPAGGQATIRFRLKLGG